MTYEDFVGELSAANISGREFARLLRLNLNTISGYKRRGDVPSNLAVIAVLMRLLAEHNIRFRERLEGLDIEPNARRGKSIADV
ncbi:XRE family transcriptional regulator [Ramlibacter sp. RBP-2]|uniref:XRE family transcriptional regulator n=1 Tax=Ramlibacter lithotrophicus TaxID=2606681 RepID=A0A7X6DGR6_9BURK|nr:XRE family transcriptional regulator [Ramlibacter lithotrophicus]NKE66872.1 XRE family transcriptional regulator [Ramlibacter lithotrophicus]